MTPEKSAKPVVIEDTFGEKLERWYEDNGKWLNVLLIVVLVGIIGYKVYDWMQARSVAKANTAYGLALQRFQMAYQSPDEAKKVDELQGAITAAQQVADEHADMFVGRQAQLMIGNAQYSISETQSGQVQDVAMLEKARDSYQKYINMAAGNSEKATGYIALGNVLENLSFIRSDETLLQEAADAYTQAMSAAEGTYLGAEAKLALARTRSARSAPESRADAAKLYEEVAKNREVRLMTTADADPAGPLKLESGDILSQEQIAEIKNMSEWSQQQVAEDALARLK